MSFKEIMGKDNKLMRQHKSEDSVLYSLQFILIEYLGYICLRSLPISTSSDCAVNAIGVRDFTIS